MRCVCTPHRPSASALMQATLSLRKKRHPFYVPNNVVGCHPILPRGAETRGLGGSNDPPSPGNLPDGVSALCTAPTSASALMQTTLCLKKRHPFYVPNNVVGMSSNCAQRRGNRGSGGSNDPRPSPGNLPGVKHGILTPDFLE